VVEPTIPRVFVGLFDRDPAACAASASEYRLEIDPFFLQFHESLGDVRDVRRETANSIEVDADFEGEGENWSRILELSLGADGALTVTQPDGSRLVRTRCS